MCVCIFSVLMVVDDDLFVCTFCSSFHSFSHADCLDIFFLLFTLLL